jgi:DNA glycosylase AlkZ-like
MVLRRAATAPHTATLDAGNQVMSQLSKERLREYRIHTYRLEPGHKVSTKEEAITFVNDRGYVYFWPVKGVELPSLWAAVAGNRPVPDEHDDPGHVTWGWKDELLGARRLYYAKVLRKRATFISLAVVPHFYALSENYGSPEEDFLLQYREGRMTWEAKTVYETLLAEGPLDTVSLRQVARMTSPASNSPFQRALDWLQADFKILPVGIAQAGAWKYAFIYDLVHRHYPDLSEEAHTIRQTDARQTLAELYLQSVGAAQARDLARLFSWTPADTESALGALTQAGLIVTGLRVAGQAGEWAALTKLL